MMGYCHFHSECWLRLFFLSFLFPGGITFLWLPDLSWFYRSTFSFSHSVFLLRKSNNYSSIWILLYRQLSIIYIILNKIFLVHQILYALYYYGTLALNSKLIIWHASKNCQWRLSRNVSVIIFFLRIVIQIILFSNVSIKDSRCYICLSVVVQN